MGTWLKRPDANGISCDCRPSVCDPCNCRYFGALIDGYYAQIAGYADGLFPACFAQVRTEPAWDGRFSQVFAEFAPCDWRNAGGESYHGQTAVLIGAALAYSVVSRIWSVQIVTIDSTAATVNAWYGESGVMSDDPDGALITRKSGCVAGPASITIARVHP